MLLTKHDAASFEEVREVHGEVIAEAKEHLTGAPPRSTFPILKKLSNKHKNAIALLLQGLSHDEVAEAVGFRKEYMTVLLKQPLAKDYIRSLNEAMDVRLKALFGRSVDAIADGLNSQSSETKLKAAKLQMQATGRLEPEDDGRKTAEDVVTAILMGVKVDVNVNR